MHSTKDTLQILKFFIKETDIWCVSLVEVTVQNFRLLFVIGTDFKSFLRYCDKLSPQNKQVVVKYYRPVFHNNHEIM